MFLGSKFGVHKPQYQSNREVGLNNWLDQSNRYKLMGLLSKVYVIRLTKRDGLTNKSTILFRA